MESEEQESYYFHTDPISTRLKLSDAKGRIVWQASFKAWVAWIHWTSTRGAESARPGAVQPGLGLGQPGHMRYTRAASSNTLSPCPH